MISDEDVVHNKEVETDSEDIMDVSVRSTV